MDYITRRFLLILIKALVLTVIIELLALLIQKEKNKKLYVVLILMNIVTNISLNIIIQLIPGNLYNIILFILEIGIILVEALVYTMITKNYKKGLKISAICNIASYIIGLLLIPIIY